MHTIGVFTTATSLNDLDDMVKSATVIFDSPSTGKKVEKHFRNLQLWMQKYKDDIDVKVSNADENLEVNIKEFSI